MVEVLVREHDGAHVLRLEAQCADVGEDLRAAFGVAPSTRMWPSAEVTSNALMPQVPTNQVLP